MGWGRGSEGCRTSSFFCPKVRGIPFGYPSDALRSASQQAGLWLALPAVYPLSEVANTRTGCLLSAERKPGSYYGGRRRAEAPPGG